MKKSFVIIALILLSVNVSNSAEYWAKTFGDRAGKAYYVQQTDDGGYIVAGYIIEDTSKKLTLLKLDGNGTVAWQKTYGKLDNVELDYKEIAHIRPFSFQLTSDSCYIIASSEPEVDNGSILVQKINNNGEILWQKTYGKFYVDRANSIQQTIDGGYIIAGTIEGELALIKIDSIGTISWQRQYYGSSSGWVRPAFVPQSIHEIPGGGYLVAGNKCGCFCGGCHYVFLMRLDQSGNVLWLKEGGHSYSHINSVQPTSDEGWVVLSDLGYDGNLWLFKLSSTGEVIWESFYGPNYTSPCTFQQTSDGGYVIGTSCSPYFCNHSLVIKLTSSGEIVWQKAYDELGSINHLIETTDEEYVIAGTTSWNDMFILKLGHEGEIPNCDIISTASIGPASFELDFTDASFSIEPLSVVPETPTIVPQDVSLEETTVCYYNSDDLDSDGMLNNEDNCPMAPNGSFQGTCTKGNIGSTCIADQACGVDGICSLNQEDTYPPDGNSCGDACECEGNFDGDDPTDIDVDGSDLATFKANFGRNQYNNPCSESTPCNGNFDCDYDVDGDDLSMFKADYGRNQYNDPCPHCPTDPWCEMYQ